MAGLIARKLRSRISGAYLLCAEPSFHKDILDPLDVVALQLDKALLYGSAASKLGFKIGTKLLEIYLVGIYALDDGHLFSIPALLNLDSDPLLLLSNLLTDAKLLGKAANSAHLRTHFVAVTSAKYTFNRTDMLLKSDGKTLKNSLF